MSYIQPDTASGIEQFTRAARFIWLMSVLFIGVAMCSMGGAAVVASGG